MELNEYEIYKLELEQDKIRRAYELYNDIIRQLIKEYYMPAPTIEEGKRRFLEAIREINEICKVANEISEIIRENTNGIGRE